MNNRHTPEPALAHSGAAAHREKSPSTFTATGPVAPALPAEAPLTSCSAGVETNHQRFMNACYGQPVDHAPLWMMRQAGRCLPEYRLLKEKHTFLELVRTPELAAEVTL